MQTNSQQLENIRTTILSLLVARKGGCTLRQLNNDYYEVEGTHIPWKDLGYISLLNFLHSMSKNVQIEQKNNTLIIKGIATDKSKHVSKLVAGQKDQTNTIGRKIYKPSHYYPKTAPPKVSIPAEILLQIINLINNYPEGLSKDYVLHEIQTRIPFISITMQEMEEQFKELSHKIYLTSNKIYPVSNKAKDFDHFNDTSPLDSGSKLHSKQEWKSAVVVASGDEDWIDEEDFDEDNFRFTAISNKKPTTNIKPTSNFIKETVSKYQEQVVGSMKLEQNNLHSLQDHEANNDNQFCQEFSNNTEEKRNGELLINERIKFRLEKLIQNCPNGIWCAELPELYLAEYKISLNYMELGFNSVREFASQLPEIFHCVQPYNTGDFKLYYAKEEIPSNSNTVKENQKTTLAQLHHIYETNDEEALPLTLSLDVCKELIPDDTVSIGECVGYISVIDLIQDEKPYIEVIVVEVFTPSFFWIQLRKKQKVFKKFMDELHNFYVMKHDEYIVPPLVLEKGLNCACMYNGIWHRGIIKTVKPDLQVTVMFYDYGTLKTYPSDAIHYLHRMFSYLPAQAIPCGLINTRPYKGSKWTRSATHHFAIRTQTPLIATIASINVEDNSMMITLTDTTEEEDVHINDWLVEQKLGEHGKMGDKVDMNNMLLYVEENLIFSPEKCYEDESNECNDNNKDSTKESINAPLILPQSTLEDTYFKSALESEKSQNVPSIAEENSSTPINNTHTTAKNYTNPFLQDTSVYNEIDLNPKKFMQLWTENLQLQMQITTTLNMLFNKLLNDTSKSDKGNLTKDENVNARSFFQANDISSINLTDMNMSNIYQDTTPPNANICNENLNTNHLLDSFQNANIPNAIGNFNENLANNIRAPPGYEKYDNKFKFDEQYLVRDMNTDLTSSDNFLNSNTPLNETNPFRLSLAGKIKIPDSQESNSDNPVHVSPILNEHQRQISDYDSILQRFIENGNLNAKTSAQEISENTCKDTLFDQSYNQLCLNNASSNTSNGKNESFALNPEFSPFEPSWSIDNVANGMSRIAINNQHVPAVGQKIKEMETNTEQYSFLETGTKEKKDLNCEPQFLSSTGDQTNEKFALNYDLNKCGFSAKLPANNLASSTLINNVNFDEGYFTRPSTSHNSYTSSPSSQLNNNKLECSQQLSKNINKSSETWVESFQNTACLNDWNKTAFLSEKSEQTIGCSKNQQHQSMKTIDTENNAGSLVNNESAGTQTSYPKGNQLKNIIKYMSLDCVIFFQVFELPTSSIHIFHYQGEGWLLTDEFIKTFTKFESTSYAVIFFYTLNIHVQYKQIDRTICPLKFINVGSILAKTTQKIINDESNIYLVQMKSVIEILDKLEIISKKDTENVLVNDSVIQDIWMINNAYRNLKYHIESAE